ncbi:MAG TPA: HD domain-containing protein, partial [Armatimonadetes bacterium]|nr:HD domain-containing protein [Armatimonadota bacterium]
MTSHIDAVLYIRKWMMRFFSRSNFHSVKEPIAMSKSQFISDLSVGDVVDSIFVVRRKQLLPFRDRPGNYLALELVDKTGMIPGRVWDEAERVDELIHERDVVKVQGRVETFRQTLQLRINAVTRCSPGEYDLRDLVPHTDKNVEQMLARVRQAAISITDQHLKTLVFAFLDDPQFMDDFKHAPASLRYHHNWLGGLLEHVVSVLDMVEALCATHPEINCDLLITGAILHDIGKLREYTWDPVMDITDEGRLIGHIILSDEMIMERMRHIPDFPTELALRVRHMVLSHHGQGEWGAPKQPMTVEAMALHLIENLNAQMARFIA